MATEWTPLALWGAVVASGIYHGLNPAMGWPLALSAALMEGRSRALWSASGYLALGHFLAMALALLPFALLAWLFDWQRQLQIGAGLLLIGFGAYLLLNRRHPRVLARIPPAQLALWSFAVALAHGAGLMLLPVFLELCRVDGVGTGHRAAETLMRTTAGAAVLVPALHTLAMIATGASAAFLVYRYLDLTFISRSWFKLDAAWAASLVVIGALSLVLA